MPDRLEFSPPLKEHQMKNCILLLCAVFVFSTLSATDLPQTSNYQYTVDLVNVVDDKVQIELIVPFQEAKTATFQMPKIIPGTYTISDFGRFVSDFRALDAQGNDLEVVKRGVNSWEIKNATALYKIQYLIEDTYDATYSNAVSGMSGTNIEQGKNYLLNAHGIFGYLEGQQFKTFDVHVNKPKDFIASSAYTNLESSGTKDMFSAKDYHFLVDMPLMYCRPDTSMVRLGGTEVLISVYSPKGLIKSSFLKEEFSRLLRSQKDYLNGNLPVERYAFIMYFMDEPLPIMAGALEHNYSSVYCLPEYPQEQMAPVLVDIASHEFFHIITPLNVHSEEIHYFDFANPEMSKHLWMYEGVTEYFAHHNQVRSGMISDKEFLNRMSEKIENSQNNYDDALAFTKLSEHCLGEHEAQYGNVYQKGALISMCIDIELLRLSDGKYGMVDMMQDLSEKFGSKEPFKDKKLFKDIKKMTYDDIAKFLKAYVAGDTPIPYGEFLAKVGVIYEVPKEEREFTLGSIQLGLNTETSRLVVTNTNSMNDVGHALGYKVGDEIVSFDGREVPTENIRSFIDDVKLNMVVGEVLEVVVVRTDSEGVAKEKLLKAKMQRVKKMTKPQLVIDNDATAEQVALRNKWLGDHTK